MKKKIKDSHFAEVIDDREREFFVKGIPKTKGSGRGIGFTHKHGPKAGRIGVRVINDNPLTASWQASVNYQASLVAPKSGVWAERPVALIVRFYLPRPASRYARGEHAWPWKKPDLDKLLRTIKDALKGVIYKDDAMVCEVSTAKFFGDVTGVSIHARCL